MIRDTSHVGSVVEPKEKHGLEVDRTMPISASRRSSLIAEARFQNDEFWRRALPGYCQQRVLSTLRADGAKDPLSVSKNYVNLRTLAGYFSTLAT
jgi:hypothetical protein